MKPADWEKLKEALIGAAITIVIVLVTGSPGMRNVVMLGITLMFIVAWYIYDKWTD